MDLGNAVTASSELYSYIQEKLKPAVGDWTQAFQSQDQFCIFCGSHLGWALLANHFVTLQLQQRSLPCWSITKWFLPWRFSSRFLELARLPGTAAVSSSLWIYYSFLFVVLVESHLLTVTQPPSSVAWDVEGMRNHSVGNCKFPVIFHGSETLCTVKWKNHSSVTVASVLEAVADHCIPSNMFCKV